MEEILRTNDLVLISVIESLMNADEIRYFIADAHMSAMEGSVGFMPRRLMAHREDAARARRLLSDAGFAAELNPIPRDG